MTVVLNLTRRQAAVVDDQVLAKIIGVLDAEAEKRGQRGPATYHAEPHAFGVQIIRTTDTE